MLCQAGRRQDVRSALRWGAFAEDQAAMILSAEQRRALELLAGSARGCTKARLLADGFTLDMLTDLVPEGLATAQRQTMKVGGRQIKVDRYRIPDAHPLAMPQRRAMRRALHYP